jgi:hypothetical protein
MREKKPLFVKSFSGACPSYEDVDDDGDDGGGDVAFPFAMLNYMCYSR